MLPMPLFEIVHAQYGKTLLSKIIAAKKPLTATNELRDIISCVSMRYVTTPTSASNKKWNSYGKFCNR